ncbi:wax ester/triacylglycerol synthase domain-containing protein [Nocardia sp. AG03]|uniref:wax ester/triacylglycerol synthase domain-containing protein n=1 Tax=Nocardia sp. AG03 TaxID=3025312 RepID=UPI00241857D1|nr:wax ester/triacylglycerol synthase domain-containing protein [Nocardia sp. AG03]
MTAELRVGAEQLRPRDAVFVYDETDRHLSSIVAVYFADASAGTPPNRDALLDWARARLGHAELFHRRLRRVPLDLDLPYWVPDPTMTVREHVRLTTDVRTWAQARARIAEITSARMDLTRPPWEIQVMDRVDGVPAMPGPTTIIVLKFHHSVGDGVATRALEQRLFGGEPAPAPRLDEPSTLTTVARTVAALGTQPVRFVTGLRRHRAAAAELASAVASGDVDEPLAVRPATRFNRDIRSPLTFHLVPLPMAAVLAAKAAAPQRVTINDLMLTTVAGALADYLAEHDETPDGSLAAMVPMSMRGVADWDSRNRLTQMIVDLHTDIADPVDRLVAIRRSANRAKRRTADATVLRADRLVETAPALLLRAAGWARAQRHFDGTATVPMCNTTISNVPPVSDTLSFLGLPVVRAVGALPILDGDGLRHLITAQGAEIVLTFTTSTAMMPDPEHYGELLLRSFHTLAAALTRTAS